ncbi:hypothetical protein JAAARDRAFT_571069 [Jaapia argillacea MUCL 33604]|uniref:Uncharacterized protein n=1 Tax=Jaapia argillacea MUCL 33604 TaxID=933084 RepID=A0A067QEL6_9AGAM|nr:hypothetical protein JAAARDRAFT_571069 [Jaapia argillacea MUCL 33604]
MFPHMVGDGYVRSLSATSLLPHPSASTSCIFLGISELASGRIAQPPKVMGRWWGILCANKGQCMFALAAWKTMATSIKFYHPALSGILDFTFLSESSIAVLQGPSDRAPIDCSPIICLNIFQLNHPDVNGRQFSIVLHASLQFPPLRTGITISSLFPGPMEPQIQRPSLFSELGKGTLNITTPTSGLCAAFLVIRDADFRSWRLSVFVWPVNT